MVKAIKSFRVTWFPSCSECENIVGRESRKKFEVFESLIFKVGLLQRQKYFKIMVFVISL